MSKTHLLKSREAASLCGAPASVDSPRTIHLDATTCPGCLAALLFDIQARAPKAGVEVTFEIGEPLSGPLEDKPGRYVVTSEGEGFSPEHAQGPRDAARQYGVHLIDEGDLQAEELDRPLEVTVTDAQGQTTALLIGPAHVEVDVEVKEKP